MKRLLFLSVFIITLIPCSYAYDFAALAPSGQILYFDFCIVTINESSDTTVTVTFPDQSYSGYTKPTGDMVIPGTIVNNGTTYTVTSIGSSAFYGCTGLTSVTVPNSVSNIGNGAFYGCTGLTSVTIPNSVTYIDNYAFFGCTGLTSVTIPNSVTYIGISVFSQCTGLMSVTIPNSVPGINSYAFYQCTGLMSVTIPNSVTYIGEYAFSGCTGLTSVTISRGVTSIGKRAFSSCTGLTSVMFNADSCMSAGSSTYYRAFYGCSNINTFTFGNNVKIIPPYLCSGRPGLTSVTIPNSVTNIGSSAFSQCTGLTSVTFNADSCTSVGDSYDNRAFKDCSNINTFTFGNNVKIIPPYLCSEMAGLTSVTIPNPVTSIGNNAFYECTGLTSVAFNADSCTSIGDSYSNRAFKNCSNINTFTFGNNVKIIPPSLCCGMTGLTSLTIPNSVINIGSSAFIQCTGLTSLTIPNSVTSIGESTFSGCTGLTSVTVPNSVTYIGSSAFSQCTGLTSVTFNADSCISAGGYSLQTFYGCSNISTFTFGSNVKFIPSYLCSGIGGLTSLTIPNSVIGIGGYAFQGCDHITNISFGNGLQNIGAAAFAGCTQVVRIKSYATTAPTIQSSTFVDLSDDVIVNVPCGYAPAYENAAYWLRFDIQEDLMYNFSATSSDPSRGTVQIINTPTCSNAEAEIKANPYHGFHFVRWSDGNTEAHRYMVVVQDTALQAEFAEGNVGIDDIEAEGISIYSAEGRIVVEGATDEVNVFDMMGRSVRNNALPAGVYLVKVGDYPARKVVVIR